MPLVVTSSGIFIGTKFIYLNEKAAPTDAPL